MSENRWDALVVGAGVGGLCAAARLSHHGYRTLVVERLDRVGGRAATEELDGFIINTGAVVVEIGGITEQTFEEVGAKFEVRPADPPILYRINGRDVDVSTGGWGLLISQLTRHGANLLTGIGAAREDGGLPDRELSTADWVRRYTKNEAVQGIFRNMCGSICAVGSEELPARVFLTYFTNKSAFKKFGFCPEGTIGLWKALAEVVEHNGGQVWLDSEVRRLLVEDDRVTGARVHRGDETVDVACAFAVSDIGPSATLDLVGPEHFPSDYVGAVLQRDLPCAMISVNFASREPLITAPGLLSFARTRRLCYVANFTATCPEMAPPGWHLYVGTGVPKPSVGDFDPEAETALVLQDLREEILGFEQTRILSIAVTRDDWPPQRAVAGYDLPHETPIANLWNVGDAVKEYANGGITACSETAKIVVDEILASGVGHRDS
ncbi:phytoene desaturase family protein [Nocardia seriolae]|uniref:phytoene desaturase family protein n=1 Tax=Nocardia seriolae TaxID=37332 RepID=UPI00051A1E05|nr:NAD(P)/FAD-dependent oxidoreductase [Nocardia seriolae]MTJ63092.1 NAD(P)-binding protein [Nocardia seriolae]MTJ73584.1 NAD(P)-binding protein [Nocardia seriolae]MTJ89102.1 NAD(P)-binding protein [Nocardia seriolae]MTK33081.1 NAD(P)-binding protein [Nocardia seriolae]MTK40985.1 NAD(P)-binding protein [Nocardia seriolae]